MTLRPLHRFMLGVLVWFPVTFMLWYWAAKYHLAPVTVVTDWIINLVVPDALMWLKLDGHTLVVASNFGSDATGNILSPPPAEDVLGFHLNPLVYSYSLPLLFSLILATPGQDKWLNLIWGAFLIFPTIVFSMVFSVLKVLTFDVGAAFQVQQGLTPFMVDIIAFCYQLGALVIPMVAPLIIWIALHRVFILKLAPQLEQVFAH